MHVWLKRIEKEACRVYKKELKRKRVGFIKKAFLVNEQGSIIPDQMNIEIM